VGREVIDPLTDLRDRLRIAGLDADANRLDDLIALYADDRGEFWIRIDDDGMWGARRSMAERVAAIDGEGDAMRAVVIELVDGMAAVGIHNARAETWAQSFGAWSRADEAVEISDPNSTFEVEPEDGS